MMDERKTEAAMEDAPLKCEDTARGCGRCSNLVRVEHVSSILRGQHIAMPGKHGWWYVRHFHKQIHIYKHHAIVKEVKQTSGTTVSLVVIHFSKSKESNIIEIFEATESYDLQHDELYIVKYVHPKYSVDEIIHRAESMVSTRISYCLPTNNCEHFTTWCVIGVKNSFQVQHFNNGFIKAIRAILSSSNPIVKCALKIVYVSADEIANAFRMPASVLAGSLVIYVLYCIGKTVKYMIDKQNGKMCRTCFKRTLLDLWLPFGVFTVSSFATFALIHLAPCLMTPVIEIPLICSLIFLTVALQSSIPKITRAVQSPFNVDTIKVKKLSDIDIGDVIYIPYYALEHAVIVSAVREKNGDSTKGQVRCIHYGWQKPLKKRTIVEEYFTVDLTRSTWKLCECRKLACHSPNETVRRARERVGESKWSLTTNRSVHLCYWAKVKQDLVPIYISEELDNIHVDKSDTKKSSIFVKRRNVHTAQEIELGDVIQCKKERGIIVAQAPLNGSYGRQFKMKLVIYGKRRYGRSKTFEIDLNNDNLSVYLYHPALCHPMGKRVKRALEKVDKKCKWWTTNGFIMDCITLNP